VQRHRAFVPVLLVAVGAARADEPTGPPALDARRAVDVRDDTPEAQREWPSDAVAYLLREIEERPELSAYVKDLVSLTAGTSEPPARFAFVWFQGRLAELTEGEEFRGRVSLVDGARSREAVFVTRTPPLEDGEQRGADAKPIENGLVRVRGIFVKRYCAGLEAETPALLVVATAVERAYETRPVRSLADVGFDAVKDDQEFLDGGGEGEPPSRMYPLTLMRLVKLAEAEVPEGAVPEELAGGMEPLVSAPAKARGRLVKGAGVVVIEPLRYGLHECPPNDAGLESYVTGWILTDGKQLLQFAAPDRLKDVGKARGDRVRFTGYFYKAKAYAARNGTTRIAPVFVFTDLATADAVPVPGR
jgi:hypothetical protein